MSCPKTPKDVFHWLHALPPIELLVCSGNCTTQNRGLKNQWLSTYAKIGANYCPTFRRHARLNSSYVPEIKHSVSGGLVFTVAHITLRGLTPVIRAQPWSGRQSHIEGSRDLSPPVHEKKETAHHSWLVRAAPERRFRSFSSLNRIACRHVTVGTTLPTALETQLDCPRTHTAEASP